MMPVMDGVEAFRDMRENTDHLNTETPVVIMTANVIVGAKEEYMQTEASGDGTDGAQRASEGGFDGVPELDLQTGLSYCMNDMDFYREMVEEYLANDKRSTMEETFAAEDWGNYQIAVHTLKSTSLTIGAVALSKQAAEMEKAAKSRDTDYIREHHAELILKYTELCDRLS